MTLRVKGTRRKTSIFLGVESEGARIESMRTKPTRDLKAACSKAGKTLHDFHN